MYNRKEKKSKVIPLSFLPATKFDRNAGRIRQKLSPPSRTLARASCHRTGRGSKRPAKNPFDPKEIRRRPALKGTRAQFLECAPTTLVDGGSARREGAKRNDKLRRAKKPKCIESAASFSSMRACVRAHEMSYALGGRNFGSWRARRSKYFVEGCLLLRLLLYAAAGGPSHAFTICGILGFTTVSIVDLRQQLWRPEEVPSEEWDSVRVYWLHSTNSIQGRGLHQHQQ